jgi:SNF2 family DNA or RNA helicase
VQEQGFGRSKMHLLEALLRLRQAACHPGLLDPKRVGDPSAKLDLLMEQLADLREEGHQALVFSQFTSLLAVVRSRLDSEGVKYAYLDGATRNRQACVDAFQTITNARCF